MCSIIYIKAEKRKSGNLFSYKKGAGRNIPAPFFLDAQKAHRLQKSVRFFVWNAQIIIASAAGEWYNKSTKNIDVSRISAYLKR